MRNWENKLEKQEHTGSRRGLFADRPRRWRYLSAMAVVVLMVGVAERTGEREVIFPEMAALAIGMWIAPKRVWNVTRLQLVLLMGAGAVAWRLYRALVAVAVGG